MSVFSQEQKEIERWKAEVKRVEYSLLTSGSSGHCSDLDAHANKQIEPRKERCTKDEVLPL